ncbi:NUDIX domain-containing protein [Yinghuangia seranimata]|uniref:NUDIX domain-containing protein n=1 Tax=Yinghuangia seranimata TaxID=408067 RepID=UPI00248B20F5|nr:NUDIX hydrolase [Yinghuangia seranimata]MDI2131830.1 NUDIX hydrolase [Yinghuangia seranimata]
MNVDERPARFETRFQDTPEEWRVTETATPYQGRVTAMRTEVVTMPDGAFARRDYLVHPGAVGVIALDERDRVLVLRQYRHPVRHKLWEVPAGLLDVPGEPPLGAAQRELYEEAHHKADDWRVLVDYYNTPGSSSEAIRVFLARGLSEATGERYEAHGEELDLELDWAPLDDLIALVLAGELHNPTLVAGVLAVHAARTTATGLDGLRPADAPWPARPF